MQDKVSGKEQAIRITPSTGLSKEEIDQMILESQQFAENDRKTREMTELRNRIRWQMASLARSYSGFGWLLDSAEQEMVKDAIQKARNLASEEENLLTMKDLLAQLENGAASLSAAMFNAPGNAAQRAEEWAKGNQGEDSIEKLMKSALDDVTSE